VARQVEGKIAYRRATKMAIASTMRMGAEGIKIQCSGRFEWSRDGSFGNV